MSTSPRSLLLATLLLPLVSAGAVLAGPCAAGRGDAGACVGPAAAAPLLAWRDSDSGWPPPDEYRGGYGSGYDSRGYYDRDDRHRERRRPPEPPRQGPLPPQAYPGNVRPNCGPGTHLEGYDCVRNPSGPAIIDQPRHGCPRDYHTNRKGTKCVRDGYEE